MRNESESRYLSVLRSDGSPRVGLHDRPIASLWAIRVRAYLLGPERW